MSPKKREMGHCGMLYTCNQMDYRGESIGKVDVYNDYMKL